MRVPEPGGPATIRAATREEGGLLGAIGARAWEVTYRGIVPDPVLDEWIATARQRWAQASAERPADSPARAWLAERDARAVGFATTSAAGSEFRRPPARAGEVTNLYLEPDVIGSGVGATLYRHAVDDLRDRGFDPLVVWAFRENVRALRFYEQMGLVIDVDDATWELGGVACPIVRFRGQLAAIG